MFVNQPWNQLFSSKSSLPTWVEASKSNLPTFTEDVINDSPPTVDDFLSPIGNAVLEETAAEEGAVNEYKAI